MFNALFGGYFQFGRAAPSSTEASTQTTIATTTTTTSGSDEESRLRGVLDNEEQQQQQHHHQDVNMVSSNEEQQQVTSLPPPPPNFSSTSLDWVLIDPNEEADKCIVDTMAAASNVANSSEIRNINDESINDVEVNETTTTMTTTTAAELIDEKQQVNDDDQRNEIENDDDDDDDENSDDDEVENDNDDVLLGSFFEKNEHVDERPEQWLITPLPCLTSVHSADQQRSMIDADPLENLLIEHPSMSVFVSATSNQSHTHNHPNHHHHQQKKQRKQTKQRLYPQHNMHVRTTTTTNAATTVEKRGLINNYDEDEDDLTLLPLFYPNYYTQQVEAAEKACVVKCKSPLKSRTSPIVKRTAEKRKESSGSPTIDQSPTSIVRLRKESKKNKKSVASSTSNKENTSTAATGSSSALQIKNLLASEFKKACASNQRALGQDMARNQMKRANRQAMGNCNNMRQRKYHKLQQPSGMFAASSYQF